MWHNTAINRWVCHLVIPMGDCQNKPFFCYTLDPRDIEIVYKIINKDSQEWPTCFSPILKSLVIYVQSVTSSNATVFSFSESDANILFYCIDHLSATRKAIIIIQASMSMKDVLNYEDVQFDLPMTSMHNLNFFPVNVLSIVQNNLSDVHIPPPLSPLPLIITPSVLNFL